MRYIFILLTTVMFIMECGDPPTGRAYPPALVINEFMASNRTDRYLDEYGDADDWIELYNSGTTPVATTGFYCTDDSTQLQKFELPDTILPPGGCLLLWADDDIVQGTSHASFQLSAEEGDEIILVTGPHTIVDRIQFFPESNNPIARVPDESYGRLTDGAATWGQQYEPSPGKPNTGGRYQ